VIGDFPNPNIYGDFFKFTGCSNIRIGDFNVDLTGTRDNIYTTGLRFLHFFNTNFNVSIGNLGLSNIAIGVHFNNQTYEVQPKTEAPDIYNGSTSFVNIEAIKAFSVGYPVIHGGSGHYIKAKVIADSCGRIYYGADIINADVDLRSRNQNASNDCGFAGFLENINITYSNTTSDVNLPGDCVTLAIGAASEYTNHFWKNIKIKLNCRFTAQTDFQNAFKVGLGVGSSGASRDSGYYLEGLDVSGTITCSNNKMFPVQFDEVSAFSTASHYSNINIHDMYLDGSVNNLRFDYLKDVATLTNIYSSQNISLTGNTTGKVVCTNVTAPELFDNTNKSIAGNVELYGCNLTSGSNWDWSVKRGLYNTNIYAETDGDTSTLSVGGGQFQMFTLELQNDSGTIKHRIVRSRASSLLPHAQLIGAFSGFSATLAALPSLGPTTDFTNGVGFDATNNQIHFNNRNAQDQEWTSFSAHVVYYDGGVSVPNVECWINSIDVNGTTKLRNVFKLTTATTGADWVVNTTNIPSGDKLFIQFVGWVR